jgi:hypothetical protein
MKESPVLHFIMGVLLTLPAPTPAPPPPCSQRRFFCGAVRLIPAGSEARRMWIGTAVATLADGVITAINTHGDPQLESNPVMRPFVRARLPGLLLGWTAMQIGQHVLDEGFHLSDERMQAFSLQQHISGVASWLSPRTYAWTPNEWESYHQPIAEAAWIRFDATAGRL